jgi:hypothetical protein
MDIYVICYVLCPLTAFIFSDLNSKMVIFLRQTESTPKHLFRKQALEKPIVVLQIPLVLLHPSFHK